MALVFEALIIWHSERMAFAVKDFTETGGTAFLARGEGAGEVRIGQSIGAGDTADEFGRTQLEQACSYLARIHGTSVVLCEDAAQRLVDIDPVLVDGAMGKIIFVDVIDEIGADAIKPPFAGNGDAKLAAQCDGFVVGTPRLKDRFISGTISKYMT